MRLLLFPLAVMLTGTTVAWLFADQLALPEDYDAVVTWLRSHGDYAWAVGSLVILGDAILPLPSTPAIFAMGLIYGPVVGALISGTAMVLASLIGYGALRALGRRAAVAVIGEDDLARTERFYERWGVAAIVAGRVIGGPAEWAVIFAALSGMPFRRVLLATCGGAFAASAVIATLGAMSAFEPELAVGITLALLGVFLLVSRGMARASETSDDTPADGAREDR